MPSLQGLLFKLRWDVINTANSILSWVSINPLTFVSRAWPTLVFKLGIHKPTLKLYSSSFNCIQALSSVFELGIHKPTIRVCSSFISCIQALSVVFELGIHKPTLQVFFTSNLCIELGIQKPTPVFVFHHFSP
jgi:hypothetical protein